jgi:hypothetical protein
MVKSDIELRRVIEGMRARTALFPAIGCRYTLMGALIASPDQTMRRFTLRIGVISVPTKSPGIRFKR